MRFRTKLFLSWVLLALGLWGCAFFAIRRSVEQSFSHMADETFTGIDRGLHNLYLDRVNSMRQACQLVVNIPELRALIAEQNFELSQENQASLRERLDYINGVVGATFTCAPAGAVVDASGPKRKISLVVSDGPERIPPRISGGTCRGRTRVSSKSRRPAWSMGLRRTTLPGGRGADGISNRRQRRASSTGRRAHHGQATHGHGLRGARRKLRLRHQLSGGRARGGVQSAATGRGRVARSIERPQRFVSGRRPHRRHFVSRRFRAANRSRLRHDCGNAGDSTEPIPRQPLFMGSSSGRAADGSRRHDRRRAGQLFAQPSHHSACSGLGGRRGQSSPGRS